MPAVPVFPGPRHGWTGVLLDFGTGLPGIGNRLARVQRVRRKRWRARLAQVDGPPPGIRDAAEGRECDFALREWMSWETKPPMDAPMLARPRDPRIRCSVIINTVDRAADLAVTLSALSRDWNSGCDELVVVLGPTIDDSREVLATAPIRCRVVECDQRNLALSRNLGLADARGDYVAFLDDDASPCAGWLERLLQPLQEDTACGVAAGFAMDGEGLKFLTRYVVSDRMGDSTWWDSHAEAESFLSADAGRFPSATGCNMAFRRDQALLLGGFDPYYAYFLEETDLVLRLHRAGLGCVACPDSVVLHRQGVNVARDPGAELLPRMRMLKSQLHFIRKFADGCPPEESYGRIWRRMSLDLERIAWERPLQAGDLQREYLRMACEEIGNRPVLSE